MERTYTLLHSLTEAEKTFLRHSLSYVPNNNKGRKNLLLKLADFMLSCKKGPTAKECLEGVYGRGESGKKILNLKKRLYNRVLDIFVLDSELQRNERLDEQDLEWIRVKKKLAQFYTLHYSGRETRLSLHLLDEAIDTSKEYEHYLVIIECLRFKKWLAGLVNGSRFFEQIQEDIRKYEFCSLVVSKAVDTVYRLNIKSIFEANDDRQRLLQLKEVIEELKRENQIAQSSVASYYIAFLEIDFLMGCNNFKDARDKCLALIPFIRSHKAVYRAQRLASVHCNLSRCQLLLGEFDSADQMAMIALKYLPPGTKNYSIAKEQEFYARFYGGKLSMAFESAKELLYISRQECGDFLHSKYNFFMACIAFRKRDFRKTNKILNNTQDISKDKAGWDVAVRIIRIMSNIELGQNNQASLMIESLRKHLAKHEFDLESRIRYKLIISLFRQMERREYDFRRENSKITAIIKSLKEKDQPHSWRLLGPELIPVHHWADRKFTEIKRSGKS